MRLRQQTQSRNYLKVQGCFSLSKTIYSRLLRPNRTVVFQLTPIPSHPTTSILSFFSFLFHPSQFSLCYFPEKINVAGNQKLQQDPTHCASTANATAVAQEIKRKGGLRTVGCPCGTRGGVCGPEQNEVRGARGVPEPPGLREASVASGRRVRVLQPRPLDDPVRRVALPRPPPCYVPLRVDSVLYYRWFPEALPRGCPEFPWPCRRIHALASWSAYLLRFFFVFSFFTFVAEKNTSYLYKRDGSYS